MHTVLASGDRLIVIAEDDDTIKLSGLAQPPIQASAIVHNPAPPPVPERSLILGWNWRAPAIINELDNYVAPDSEVTVVCGNEKAAAEVARQCHGAKNQKITCLTGDTTDRRTLDSLNATRYHHLIVLSYSDELDVQQADAQTLITLLHLRDISDRAGQPLSIVSEMLDLRNRALAEVTKADDFIVSDKLVSLMLSQVSENKQLNGVFTDIFDPEGSEIYVKPASQYVALDTPVSFYTVVESARQRGEVAIGYRLRARATDASQAYGVVVNPKKSARVMFSAADRVIVIAEE